MADNIRKFDVFGGKTKLEKNFDPERFLLKGQNIPDHLRKGNWEAMFLFCTLLFSIANTCTSFLPSPPPKKSLY